MPRSRHSSRCRGQHDVACSASQARGGCVAATEERKTDTPRGKVGEHDVLDNFAAGRSLRLSNRKLQHGIRRCSDGRRASLTLRLRHIVIDDNVVSDEVVQNPYSNNFAAHGISKRCVLSTQGDGWQGACTRALLLAPQCWLGSRDSKKRPAAKLPSILC